MGLNQIVSELVKVYKVEDTYYPKFSIETDIEGGLNGEAKIIVNGLSECGFDISTENVFKIMEIKRLLLSRYLLDKDGIESKQKYTKLLLEEIKPVGSLLPIDFLLVNGVVAVTLYLVARFGGSFMDEAGKIAAQKVLGQSKKAAKKLNMDVSEYNYFIGEIHLLIQNGELERIVNHETLTKSKSIRKKTKFD